MGSSFFKTFYALWWGCSQNGWTDFDAQYVIFSKMRNISQWPWQSQNPSFGLTLKFLTRILSKTVLLCTNRANRAQRCLTSISRRNYHNTTPPCQFKGFIKVCISNIFNASNISGNLPETFRQLKLWMLSNPRILDNWAGNPNSVIFWYRKTKRKEVGSHLGWYFWDSVNVEIECSAENCYKKDRK